MQIDQVSIQDISIFHTQENNSIFQKVNFTKTVIGAEHLKILFKNPLHNLNEIEGTQQVLKNIVSNINQWPNKVSNGTILVMEKFLEFPLDYISEATYSINNLTYKWLHNADYSMLNYSIRHFDIFLNDLKLIIGLLQSPCVPKKLDEVIGKANKILNGAWWKKIMAFDFGDNKSTLFKLQMAHQLRYQLKQEVDELINIYGRLDAWYAMAFATKEYGLSFPQFEEETSAKIHAESLYHLLLTNPVEYDVEMDTGENFIFLTGANMAGKSTFIKAIGSAVYLAHLGMAVPAKKFRLSLFEGILSNVDVSDSIAKGESYFYNEVQRIKKTIEKVNDGNKWLVLIDEMFRGTNIQDAMKCSLAVVKGLIKIKSSLFILSTHLYEITDELVGLPDISFKYFETQIENNNLKFTYKLKDGVSNDRIGYVILSREKVIEMLDAL